MKISKSSKATNYRKIYESHFGSIPTDEFGRSYEIHHIDGNHSNNDINNLKAVTIQDHYDLHYQQGDYQACVAIAIRMRLTPDVISSLASLANKSKVVNGTHHWLSKKHSENTRYLNNKRYAEGNHPVQQPKEIERIKSFVENNEHHWQSAKHRESTTRRNLERVANGTHPSQIKRTCEHCGTTCGLPVYGRLHGDKCRRRA